MFSNSFFEGPGEGSVLAGGQRGERRGVPRAHAGDPRAAEAAGPLLPGGGGED